MTRINLIPVKELTDQHLLAEHREIKRIPNLIKSWKYNLNDIPKDFCLWKWHVKFFYNKIEFLHRRYLNLFFECIRRWFKINDYSYSFYKLINNSLYNDYIPTEEEIEISRKRINEKINNKPNFYRYKWKLI